MINIAVLVSGNGTNLQALIDACKCGVIKSGEIRIVISSSKSAYALSRAKQNNIKTKVVDKHDFNNALDYDNKLIEVLKANEIELIVLAGFMTILSKHVIDTFANRIINVHPSLIPSFCGKGYYGLKVHEAALKRGVKVSGATVHFVSEVCDAGPIIAQKAVEVMDDDTPQSLQQRVMEKAEWVLLPSATQSVCEKIMGGEV